MSRGRRGGEGASSAQRQETLRKTGWKEEAAATTGCNVRKAAAPGAGQSRVAHRSRPRLPYSRWPRAQELPEVGEVKRTYARSPCPQLRVRGIPKVEGPLCQVRCQVFCFLRPLTGSENPANRGCNPDDPVPPRPSPPRPPPAETAPRLAPSSTPTPPGTLISMTTWEDSLGGGGGAGDTPSQPPPAPSWRPPQATALRETHSHKCCFQLIAQAAGGGAVGGGPGRRPRPEAGAPLVGLCVRSAAACTSTTPACKFEM